MPECSLKSFAEQASLQPYSTRDVDAMEHDVVVGQESFHHCSRRCVGTYRKPLISVKRIKCHWLE